MSDTQSTSTNETAVPRFRDAYEHLLDEIRKVPTSDFVRINIDVPLAVTTALGALPEITALRPSVVAEMPTFDIARFDKLEAYTLALGHAHARWMAASAPIESLDAVSAEGTAVREILLADASALAQRGFIDSKRLSDLKGPNGHRNLAFDLFALSALLRDTWPRILGKTALSLAELDKAETIADRLLTAVGLREQGPGVVAESATIRQQAFSLFVSAYDHVRRALSYLRWQEDDLEKIAPSLYAGRTTSRKEPEPAPAPAHTPAPEPPAKAPVSPAAPQVQPAPTAVGLPESAPFAR